MGNSSQRAQLTSSQNNAIKSPTSSVGSAFASLAVDGAEVSPKQPEELVTTNNNNSSDRKQLKKSLVFSIEEGHVFGDGLELDLLPIELWDMILSFCDDNTTSRIIPLICKVLYNVTSADSAFWKFKSKQKHNYEDKPSNQTWKRFYFSGKSYNNIIRQISTFTVTIFLCILARNSSLRCPLLILFITHNEQSSQLKLFLLTNTPFYLDNIKLFPLMGFEIGNATYAELLKTNGAVANTSGSSRYVTTQRHNFWVETAEPGKFTFMYIVRNIYPMPE